MIKLQDISTKAPNGISKDDIRKKEKQLYKKIGKLQYLLQAESKYSILLVLQGMDASGKDGIASRLFKYCAPSGIDIYSFKKPTDEEFSHDFLWRIHKQAPQKGQIKVFNRSHYEDILIQRVHGWIDEDRVTSRIEAINAFENILATDNNTQVVKCYLHMSKEEQEVQLQERIDDPTKHWKHNDGDWKERQHWDRYMECYEDAINRSAIPWHIVPVDDRWYKNYAAGEVLLNVLESLHMNFPPLVRDA